MKRNGDKKRILKISLIILVIVIILVGGFFGFKEYKKWRENKDGIIFEQGFTYGYTNAIIQIMNISYACEPFPVFIGNQSRELIAIDCLNFV